MKRLASATVAAALITFVTACGGPDPSVIRVGTLSDSRPNAYSENGRFTGFDNELLRVIAADEGLKLEFVATDFSTLLGQVAGGQFDIGSAAVSETEARRKTVDFSNAYNYQALAIESAARSAAGPAISDEKSLADKRIGVVQGTVSDTWLTSTAPTAQIVRLPTDAAVVGALNAGSVDGAVFDKASAEQYATENPGLKITKSLTTTIPQGYAVRKGNGELLARINDGLVRVIADGTWLKLHQRFEPNDEVPPEFNGNG